MEFELCLRRAQAGDEGAILELLRIYRPLLRRYSYIDHHFSEDLMQVLTLKFMIAVRSFRF